MSQAIARLTDDSVPRGAEGATAFAISEGTALTAFHCVGDRATEQLRRRSVRLAFRSGQVTATVVDFDAALDVALLKLDDPVPPEEDIIPISDEVGRESFWSRGFPIAARGVEVALSGRIVDADARPFDALVPALQLHCEQSSASSPLPLGGFSGAPILADDPPRAVGLIRWNPPSPGNRQLALGAIVYGTPLSAVLSRWGEAMLGTEVLRPSQRSRKALADGLLRIGTDAATRLPQLREVNPRDLGPVPTRYSRAARDPYVDRPMVDERLAAALSNHKLVLIVGPATSGKSRSAAQALHRALPDAGLLWPKSAPQSLGKLLDLDSAQPLAYGQLVVWLDNLEQYLSEDGGLDSDTLEVLLRREPPAFVVATMTLKAYEESLTSAGDRSRIMRQIIDDGPFFQVELSSEVSAAEREEAARAYPDEDWSDESVGIAERLTAGRILLARLKAASEKESACWLAVRAAIDWQRAGAGAIPEPTWRQLFTAWSSGRRRPRMSDGTFDAAVRWAQVPAASAVALVSCTDDLVRGRQYSVLGYVAENIDPDGPVADATWELAITSVRSPDDLTNVLLTAVLDQGREDVATRIVPQLGAVMDEMLSYVRSDGSADTETALHFAEQLLSVNDARAGQPPAQSKSAAEVAEDSAAIRDDEEAARGGDVSAMITYGKLLSEAGQRDQAEAWFRKAARTGSALAMVNLGAHYFRMGEVANCVKWTEKAAARRNVAAMVRAAWLAHEYGREAHALRWARRAAKTGAPDGLCALGELLASRGQRDEAIRLWLRAADQEHMPSLLMLLFATGGPAARPEAAVAIGEALRKRGDAEQAMQLWEAAARAGSAPAAYRLGLALRERGDLTGAHRWLSEGAQAGLAEAATALGVVLLDLKDTPGALKCWHKAADQGDAVAAHNIAFYLAGEGKQAEAATWYERAARGGYAQSAYELGMRCRAARDREGARRWLTQAAEAGFVPAMASLGDLLAADGATKDARTWFVKAADQGDGLAALGLYQLDALAGDLEAARCWLDKAAAAGMPLAAARLASIADYSRHRNDQ